MRLPGLFQTIAAVVCIIAATATSNDGFMFAAVFFGIAAAEARIMDVIRSSK